MVEENGRRGRGRQGDGDVVECDGEGDGELDDLVEEDGCGGEVARGAVEGHDARVVHYLGLVSKVRCVAGVAGRWLWEGWGTYEDQRRVLEHELCERVELVERRQDWGGELTVIRETCFMGTP